MERREELEGRWSVVYSLKKLGARREGREFRFVTYSSFRLIALSSKLELRTIKLFTPLLLLQLLQGSIGHDLLEEA